MPFGLKNVGATYQQAMTLIFHDMIHKTMEDYVHDILEKSKKRRDHIEVLGNIFDQLEEYKVKLNPKKCVFGVTYGIFLGYIVCMQGIEVDLAKVEAILDTEAPKTLKLLQGLQGRLYSIRRFIAQLANNVIIFSHLLHKGISYKWDHKYDEAFP